MTPDDKPKMTIQEFMDLKPESRLYAVWDYLKTGEEHFADLDAKFTTLQGGNKAIWEKLNGIEKKLDGMCGGCVAIEIRKALEEHKGDQVAHPDDKRLMKPGVVHDAVIVSVCTTITAIFMFLAANWPFH